MNLNFNNLPPNVNMDNAVIDLANYDRDWETTLLTIKQSGHLLP